MPYVSCTKLDAEVSALEAQIETKQNQLNDSSGGPLAGGTCILSCSQIYGLIDDVGNITAGTNTSVLGNGSAASPYIINVADASETTKGAIEIATLAETQAGVDSLRAVTPATLKVITDAITAATNAGLDTKQDDLNGLDGGPLPGGACVMTCAEVLAAIEADTDKITLVATGNGYTFTNGDNVSTFINPMQFVSTDAGNALGVGADGGIKVLIPAQLPDDQVLTGDNSGNVSLTLTPVVDPGTGNTNYTILANLKSAATNPSGGTNLLVSGASGWYVALRDCAGNYLGADAQVATCGDLSSAVGAVIPGGGADGQVLTKQADGSYAWESLPAQSTFSLVDCNGAAVASGASVATCTNLDARIPTGGSAGQVLTKQPDGTNAWTTPSAGSGPELPAGGSAGQVLTKQADGSVAWVTPTSGGGATGGITQTYDGPYVYNAGSTSVSYTVTGGGGTVQSGTLAPNSAAKIITPPYGLLKLFINGSYVESWVMVDSTSGGG